MATDFSYLAKKITDSDFAEYPFKHVYIEDFLQPEHFEAIIACPEIASPPASSDSDLFSLLKERGYEAIEFPGAITDEAKYIDWHENGAKRSVHTATEGFGVVLRLLQIRSEILQDLNDFLESDEFNRAVAEKMGVPFAECSFDGGIQKYLDGYEISPHPDIRKKAATFMVNINPNDESEVSDHHTHYLTFKPERQFVQSFWEGHPSVDRCWVPWEWCESHFQQRKNNTIVLFSPADDTMHAVRASYDHLKTQRTQLYGNLWYTEDPSKSRLEWEDFEIEQMAAARAQGGFGKRVAKSIMPDSLIDKIRSNRT